MNWKRCMKPSHVHACSCGSDIVEVKPDGMVREYRCGDCHTNLGNTMMGHEP